MDQPTFADWEYESKKRKTRTRTGQRLTGIGRNVDLFRAMVSEAHQPRWHRVIAAEGYAGAWLEHVREQNVALWHPDELPDAECRSIAKSCANYSLRQFSEADYSAIQTQRNALVLESGLQKSAKLRLSFSAPAGHNSRAKGSNSQAALSIVKNGPQLGARASAESNPGGGSQPRFS